MAHEDMGPLLTAVGLSQDAWRSPEHVNRRWTVSFAEYLRWVGLDSDSARAASELRLSITRRALVPIDGALEAIAELRARGLRLGLISNCSGDVVELWEGSPFGGLFDAVVLSASEGVCKPDERIYRIALRRLDVAAEDALFVGDGHSDELAGAEAVGMRAVQIGSFHWDGERIADLRELPGLV